MGVRRLYLIEMPHGSVPCLHLAVEEFLVGVGGASGRAAAAIGRQHVCGSRKEWRRARCLAGAAARHSAPVSASSRQLRRESRQALLPTRSSFIRSTPSEQCYLCSARLQITHWLLHLTLRIDSTIYRYEHFNSADIILEEEIDGDFPVIKCYSVK